jgi:serine/threonine-protein kinase HipA
MGALTYEPDSGIKYEYEKLNLDFDEIAEECREVLQNDSSKNIDELFQMGGSSGGARPKILTKINNEDWIIKFPSSEDKKDIGFQEYMYSICAKKCGIEMEETKLFPSKVSKGYFGTKRFDRSYDGESVKRIHMASVSGLLETSHRIPNLDYDVLMKLTLELTNDFKEIEKLYKLMCFNVFSHNRDDHSKNFSFIYNDYERKWKLAPAYDLTYSNSIGGEHATMIHGEGKNPGLNELIEVGKNIGMNYKIAKKTAIDIRDCIKEEGIF